MPDLQPDLDRITDVQLVPISKGVVILLYPVEALLSRFDQVHLR